MLIIFEGPERTGKTNIAKALANRLGFYYFKANNEQFVAGAGTMADRVKYGSRDFFDFIAQHKLNVIIDRSFISEYVYSRVLGNREILPISFYETQEAILTETTNPLVIYCHKTWYDIDTYDDELIPINLNESIHNLYLEYCEFSTLPWLKINTTDKNIGNQLEKICTFIGK